MKEKITALKVNQWLPGWDRAAFSTESPRRKPQPFFYVFSISAYDLRQLSGIYRRDASAPPAKDRGIQRRHDPDKSKEILRYLEDGFPLSRIQKNKLINPTEESDLRMPGWIPTAVTINILKSDDKRTNESLSVSSGNLITITEESEISHIHLPPNYIKGDWLPDIHPIEVIDGQHRLWALTEDPENPWSDDYRERIKKIEIPVVAFHGLDTTWQAYLFYTINQLPKRIDSNVVFDLYPLLRTEDWLLRFEGANVYRETRAQDLTMVLWSHPASPWQHRIIRLEGRQKGKVGQAAFIRALMSSFIKPYKARSGAPGGLFGTAEKGHLLKLNWNREQQAALLIIIWQELQRAIVSTNAEWAQKLLSYYTLNQQTLEGELSEIESSENRSLLFSGPDTLAATDQGVNSLFRVMNTLLWVAQELGRIDLTTWVWERIDSTEESSAIDFAIKNFRSELPDAVKLIQDAALSLSTFDWRVSSAVPQADPNYSKQASYRGSSGYREMRSQLQQSLLSSTDSLVKSLAAQFSNTTDEEE